MQSKYSTGVFRILKQTEPTDCWMTVKTYYIVQKRVWLFWWSSEKYWKHKNDSPGKWYTYKFDTERKALEYINKTNYTTKVLWTTV